jgi:hypothetical protein
MEILFAANEKNLLTEYFSLVLHNPYFGPDKYPASAKYKKTVI